MSKGSALLKRKARELFRLDDRKKGRIDSGVAFRKGLSEIQGSGPDRKAPYRVGSGKHSAETRGSGLKQKASRRMATRLCSGRIWWLQVLTILSPPPPGRLLVIHLLRQGATIQ